jgi:hypothetical protein
MKPTRDAVLLIAVSSLISCAPSPEEIAKDRAERNEMMAKSINLHGYLCAEVLFVSPELSTGEFQVNCSEYRDPAKAQTKHNLVMYMVSPTGAVTFMGRG